MVKIRIIAALIALVLTALTALIVPYLFTLLMHWLATLNAEQKQWFSYSQVLIGVLVAGVGYKMWKKKKV